MPRACFFRLRFSKSLMSNAPYSPPSPYSAPSASAAEAVFAPLPLRPRNVLENLDLAFKLFKQYWKPLLAWAAIANALMTVVLYFGILVGPPFIIAPACCVLAAAVRGQRVGFRQCWGFARPRLWNLLAVHVLSSIVAAVVMAVACGGLFALSVWIGSRFSGSFGVGTFLIVVVAVLALSVVLSMALAWQGMVSMVACMEDDNRDSRAMKRAWVLLRGRWKAALGLLTILNLALMVLWGALWGIVGLMTGADGLGRALQGNGGLPSAGLLGYLTASSWLLFTLFMPLYYLAQGLFYLDARVRHEALDLEWDAHRSENPSPQPRPQPRPQPQANTPQTFFERIEAPYSPAQAEPSSGAWAANPFAPQPAATSAEPATSAAPTPSEQASSAEPAPSAQPESWTEGSPFAPR